jgi:iron-sulfur cluster assembly protein
MINLTTKAVSKVKEILKNENKDNWGLRVGLKQGGCSGFTYMLGIDENPAETDQVFEHEGLKVLSMKISLLC